MSNVTETNVYAVGATLRSFSNGIGERSIAPASPVTWMGAAKRSEAGPINGPSTGGVCLNAGDISRTRHVDGPKQARQTMFPMGVRSWRPPV